MKTEYLKEENCPQRDSTEYEEYAEVSSIYLPVNNKRMVTKQDKTDHLEEMEEVDNKVQETGASRDTA